MTQRDPDRRLSVQEYLSILQGKWSPLDEGKGDGNKAKEAKHEQSQGPASVSPLASSILLSRAMAHTKDEESSVKDNSNPFPDYFEEFVYPLFLKLHWNGVTPDERLVIICENYGKMMHIIANEIDEEGGEFFSTALNSTALHHHDDSASNQLADEKKLQNAMKERREEPSIDKNYGESLQENLKYIPVEDLMRRAQLLLSEAENSLEDKNSEVDDLSGLFNATSTMLGSYIAPQSSTTDNTINNQQTENDHHRCSYRHEGLVLIVNILASNFRHLRFPQSKMVCLMLLVKIGSKCTDDVILQRVIPTVLVGVTDQSAPVRAVTIRALRVLLSVVQEFSILEANLFPMYIFPALNRLVDDSEICVRIAFVESIGRIAEAAKKFLDRAHFAFMNKILGDDGNSAAAVSANQYSEAKDMIIVEYPYDAKLEQLREQVNKWIKDLMIDNTSFGFNASVQQQGFKFGNGGHFDSLLKRVLLIDIMKLCVFFGQEATTDKLLTRILTFLNDPVS